MCFKDERWEHGKIKIIKLMISYECVGRFWFYQYVDFTHHRL
jgi:hypothetical protein